MAHKYLVQCWIKPQSGFDLAQKNRIMSLFKEIMTETMPNDPKLDEALKRFEKSHDGMVLEPMIIESDKEVTDPEKELLPEIQKSYPEAVIFSWEPAPKFVKEKKAHG